MIEDIISLAKVVAVIGGVCVTLFLAFLFIAWACDIGKDLDDIN